MCSFILSRNIYVAPDTMIGNKDARGLKADMALALRECTVWLKVKDDLLQTDFAFAIHQLKTCQQL